MQEDNSKTDLEETMCEDVEWIYVVLNRKWWYTVSMVLGLPSFMKERGILWSSFATSSFSRTHECRNSQNVLLQLFSL